MSFYSKTTLITGLLLFGLYFCTAGYGVEGQKEEALPPAGLLALAEAYGEYCQICEEGTALCWPDGTVLYYDDGEEKDSYEDLLNRASLKDQMAQPYPAGTSFQKPIENEDPGRVRNERFFRKIYGNTAAEVQEHLVSVPWLFGKTIRITRINGADQALRRVCEGLKSLPVESQRYVEKSLGSFNWRKIARTERLSMHSFGIALDFQLPPALHRYWQWETKTNDPSVVYPSALLHDTSLLAIVRIFEEEGFIWGGKWYHYDSMHFEYRPELLTMTKAVPELFLIEQGGRLYNPKE